MSDLQHYFLRQAERRAAKHQYNHASAKLELAGIRERMAELKSQYEPLHSLCDGSEAIRQKVLDAVFYVVVGRWDSVPDKQERGDE